MSRRLAFIYDDALTRHTLSDTHPMKPIRLRYTYELLEAYGVFEADNVQVVVPRLATEAEILSHHTERYVEAVRKASLGDQSVDLSQFNMGPGDNPSYSGMYEAAALSSGGSIKGAEKLASDELDSVFNISGGLHHAMPGYALGFCVFNDPVLAIKELLNHGMRVAYVDIDCHHGDGVQHAFYDTDSVLTISIHESGAFLFPGTGFVQEIGVGRGRGFSVNLPLYPQSSDEVYLWTFREIVPPLLESFRPDILVTQLGIDSHFLDPITHMSLTVQGFADVVTEFNKLDIKWLALGGGGYDVQAVARAWTLAFGVMAGHELSDEIPDSYAEKYGVRVLRDRGPTKTHLTIRETREFAEDSVKAIRHLVFPIHGLRTG